MNSHKPVGKKILTSSVLKIQNPGNWHSLQISRPLFLYGKKGTSKSWKKLS